ncbi:hypothetical protein F7725_012841 [Dissostichus mawsoni]|uniref:Rapamycin-insensitive companion of mTOR N-terminal domain-containing protein n=1 Tax=Dissostichus mawsoni TaxID=36200 RepID=A0A7J5YQQ9_DISMA|nr:hypothetical protein F7725_012841 [Dissostichus mawsoni]
MAASFRGRPIRSLRMRGRMTAERKCTAGSDQRTSENFREILQNVAKPHGLLCSINHREENFGLHTKKSSLRLALLNEAKEVRAAGLRRSVPHQRHHGAAEGPQTTVDYLIARCIDIQQSNEGRGTQALRLVRKIITVNAMLFPPLLQTL